MLINLYSFIRLFSCSFARFLVCLFVCLFVCSFVRLLVSSFVRVFVRSFNEFAFFTDPIIQFILGGYLH